MGPLFKAGFRPGFIYQWRQSLRSLAASITSQAGLSSAIWKTSSQQLICVESTQGREFSHFFTNSLAKLLTWGIPSLAFLYCSTAEFLPDLGEG